MKPTLTMPDGSGLRGSTQHRYVLAVLPKVGHKRWYITRRHDDISKLDNSKPWHEHEHAAIIDTHTRTIIKVKP